jgi:putative ABC transport system permease protein
MAVGFEKTMTASASADSAIVLRSGANDEMSSGLEHDDTRIVADTPGLASDKEGPLSSPELFVIINVPKRSTLTDANVPLRGVQPSAFRVHDKVGLVKGRQFDRGKNEVIVGVGAEQEFAGLEIGNKFKVGRSEWEVVGIFSSGGGTSESEIWTDAAVLQDAYHRGNTYQSVSVKLAKPGNFLQVSNSLASDPRLQLKAMRLDDFYAKQSTMLHSVIAILGYLVASFMAVGAVFGALNTMYNSVSARSREIATLRALGFGGGAVVTAVMIESVAVALFGGSVGAIVSYAIFNGFHTAAMNWQSFSQVAFSFDVTVGLLATGVIWAVMIGLIGGLAPAVRAARLPIAAALREL